MKKRKRLCIILLACFIYIISIAPIADLFITPLEKAYRIPSIDAIRKCDAYVVLGGGVNVSAPTVDGKGMPSGDALFRVMGAYRLYLLSPKPIIISGGNFFGKEPEAEVTKRFLKSIGVKESDIIAESKSQDTFENAQFTRNICKKRGIKRILLITSAYHMKRSVMLFQKHFSDILPFPTDYKVSEDPYDVFAFLPDASNIARIAAVLKEYMGILFYKITL